MRILALYQEQLTQPSLLDPLLGRQSGRGATAALTDHQAVAEAVGPDVKNFARLFQGETGVTPRAYQRENKK